MPIGPAIAAAAPVIGSLAGGLLQRNWALKDWHRINEYNHPKNQVKRLQEAGLPLASMFSGSGGSTSTDVRGSQIDPSLGTAEGLQAYNQNRMVRKQLQLMDENIGKAEAEKIIAQVGANKALEEDRFYQGPKYDDKGFLIEGNRRQDSLALSMREQEARTKTVEIIADLQRAKTEADIKHVLSTVRLGLQQWQYNKVMQYVDKWTVSQLLDGKGLTGLEAMLYNFFVKKGSLNPVR